MGYFDACEACGQTEFLVVGGLCFDCERKAERAAVAKSVLPRRPDLVFVDGRVRTTLAPRMTPPDKPAA